MSESASARRDVVRKLTNGILNGDKVALGTLNPELRGEIIENVREAFKAEKALTYDDWDDHQRKFYREVMKTLNELGRENPSFVHVQFKSEEGVVMYGAPLRPYNEKTNLKKSEPSGGTYDRARNELKKLEYGYRPRTKETLWLQEERIHELEVRHKEQMERANTARRKVEQLRYTSGFSPSFTTSYQDLKVQKRLEYRSESKIEYVIDYTGGWLFPYTLYMRQGAFRAHPKVFWTYRAAKVRGEYYVERQRIVKARLQGFREMQMTDQQIWEQDFNS